MVLQVRTTQFQSTAGQTSRTPVETFVAPVEVLPKTNLMGLAETLKEINPTLQKFVNFEIQKAKQEGILEGQNLLLGANDKQITEIKKQLANKDKRIMRNFVGGNMYMEYGIEKQLAMNLGSIAEGKTNQFFANHKVEVPTKDGGTTFIPLSQFDVNSKEFQNAIEEFKRTQLLDTKGIRPELLNRFFFPQQNQALSKAISKQVEAKADANIKNYTNLLTNSSLQYFRNIPYYDESIENNILPTEDGSGLTDGYDYARSLLQQDTDYTYKLGLDEVVSVTGMVEIIKKNAYVIYKDFEDGNTSWVDTQAEFDDYLDFMYSIKVGPIGFTKNGEPIQKTLGEFLDGSEEIIELKKEIYQSINNKNKEQAELVEAGKKTDILETFKTINYSISPSDPDYTKVLKKNVETLKALITKYPNLKEFIVKEYDLRNDNVDLWFDRFNRDFNNGKFKTTEQARARLDSFMVALGSTASKEDRTRYEKSLQLINKESGQGILSNHPEFKLELEDMKEALRDQKSPYTLVKIKYTNKFNDLTKEYRKKIDVWATTDYKSQEEKDKAKEEIIIFLKEQTYKILTDDYKFYDALLKKLDDASGRGSFDKNKLFDYESLADGGPVKKNKPVIVGDNPDGSINKTTELFVPKSDGNIIPSNKTIIHEVKSGENLSTIADQYEGIEYTDIIDFNKYSNDQANNLSIGQKIPLPEPKIQESKEVLTQKLNEVLKNVDTTKPFNQDIIMKMLLAVGFNEADARIMSAVGMAESAGDGSIDTIKSGLDPKMKKEFSIGLFQINMLPEFEAERFPLFGITSIDELYDPITNVIAAKRLFDKYGFEAWGAYKNNSYKDFLSN